MADDTFAARTISKIYVSGNPHMDGCFLAEALAPGDTVRIHSDGKGYAVKNSDGPASGVVECSDGHEIDTDYDVGDWVEYYPVGQDTVVWCKYVTASPAVPIRHGQPVVTSGTDDQVMLFAYTDAAVATDTLQNKVGRARCVDTGHNADMHLIKVALAG